MLVSEPTLPQQLADNLDGTFEAVVLAMQAPAYRLANRYCGNAAGSLRQSVVAAPRPTRSVVAVQQLLAA